MNPEFPPNAAPLEVDRVEWVPASPEAVHVRVYGRWVDRPVGDALVLLVGSERRRHAFDAVEGAPGALATFSVPNELRPRLAEDIALQIGAHELALPAATPGSVEAEAPEAEAEEAEVIDRAVLAERRARRAELAEQALERRAEEAEQTAKTLEAQLGNLEERLAQAREERDEIEGRVAEAERRLRAAEQREYAEQQQRIEAQDELEALRASQTGEVEELRGRLDTANRRAEELAREVDRARRSIAEAMQRSEADRAALRRVEAQLAERDQRVAAAAQVEQRQDQLDAALSEVQERAAELQRSLDEERRARERVEAALRSERDEAAAKVTLLEHELSDRAAIQQRIASSLAAVREELDRTRAQVEARDGTAESIAQLQAIADRLKDRIVDLEKRKEATEAELGEVRALLSKRSAELERARIELRRAEREAEVARHEAKQHHAALEQANRTIDAVRRSAGELQLQLDVERRERAQAEALLHEQLATAQADGRRSLTEVEVELRMALETERNRFAAEVSRIEAHVAGLRDQVVTAAAQLRDAVDSERAARQAAERQLAEAQDRVTTERTAASEALAQLALEQARRRELEAEVREALSAVRGVRADDEARAARDAAVQRLVSEVLGTAASLREAFEAESRKLEGELTGIVVEERRKMAEELQAMESRASELQHELHGAGEDLEAELQAERTARWLAEAELARERQRSGTAVLQGENERLQREMSSLQGELNRARRLAEGEPGAQAGPGDAREAEEIIAGLTSAAERLREEQPPVAEGEEPETASEAPRAAPGAAATVDAATVDAPSVPEAPAPEPPAPAWSPPAAYDAPRPSGAVPLVPRVSGSLERTPWLARAIAGLATQDELAAARLVVGLLPVQRLLVDGDLTYDLTVHRLGTFRVVLHEGATTIDAIEEPGGRREVDFHLQGSALALAEFAAGGIRKRPRETSFDGSRRKLRKLLKAMREPVGLPDVSRSGAAIDPALVLTSLCVAMEPEWTAGHTFSVAFDVTGPHGGHATVVIDDGARRVEADPQEEPPAATVHAPQAVFLPLLAGIAPPPGHEASATGNVHAIELLRSWFDQAQGLT